MENDNILKDYLNTNYENLLLNLKIISLLGEKEKIFTNTDTISTQNDKSYIPEFISRWWNAENRLSNIDRIQDIVNSVGKLTMEDSFVNTGYINRFFNELTNSLKGLHSLKKTYRTDTVVLAKIETTFDIIKELIKEIKLKIDENEKKKQLNKYYENSDDNSE
jgi:hypothetical protein